MPTAYQIEKIEDLSRGELDDLIIKILSKQEFESIELLEDCIKAKQRTFLNKSAAVFITFPFKLGGLTGVDYQAIAQKINQIREKYAANNVFVYSNRTISKGFQTEISNALKTIRMTYISRDDLIQLVDEIFPEYWRHDDIELIQYEKDYTDFVANDSDLKKLKFPNDKYAKLLDIFIEPMLMRYYQDAKTNNPVSKKYSVNELIAHDEAKTDTVKQCVINMECDSMEFGKPAGGSINFNSKMASTIIRYVTEAMRVIDWDKMC